jgi:UDP-N-acetylglucosamine:LPS N-acetylglucosamine transferase
MKICVVSSCGGHLTEVRRLLPAYGDYEHFYVLNDRALLPLDMEGKTFFITHSERDWKFLLNLWEAWRILRQERPGVILSTGAGPAVPFALIGRLFFRARVIFVETITRIETPSVTGRIMYFLAHHLFYQWPALSKAYPRGIYGGPLL